MTPTILQMSLSNIVGVVWTGYLTYAANRDTRTIQLQKIGTVEEEEEGKGEVEGILPPPPFPQG